MPEAHSEPQKPAPRPTAARSGAPRSAEDLIRECLSVIQAYLPPDSAITEHECLDELLTILDGPDARRFAPDRN
jgi:hypothetical protein